MKEQKVLITKSEIEINNLIQNGWKVISITAQSDDFCVLFEREKLSPPVSPGKFQAQIQAEINDIIGLSSEDLTIPQKEKEMIIKSLIKNHWNRRNAAQELGISERTIYRKLKEYKLA